MAEDSETLIPLESTQGVEEEEDASLSCGSECHAEVRGISEASEEPRSIDTEATSHFVAPSGHLSVTLPFTDMLLGDYTGTGSALMQAAEQVPSDVAPIVSPLIICISEVQWMGTDLSTADEWLEITAIGSAPSRMSLAGWSIMSVQGGIEEPMITFGPEQDIGAGEFRIVSNYSADASRLLHGPYHVTTSISLPNTKLLLRIIDASGVVMDEVDDGVGAPFAGANPSGGIKASMERIDCLQPGTVQENWRTATAARGWDEEALVLGTPGFPNGSGEDVPDDDDDQPVDSTGSIIPLEPLHKPFISEVLPDPSGLDTQEWIEIGNSGSGSILLDGWSVVRGTSVYRFPPGTGSLLGSGQYLQLPALITTLTLPNAGGEVLLLYKESIIDRLTYPLLPEGVSFGRLGEEVATQSFCVPTPGMQNALLAPTVLIEGAVQGETVSTINLSLKAESGSIAGAQCAWDFGDGYLYDKCNPPSHAMRSIGQTIINMTLQDYCGNTVIQSLTVSVDPKTISKTLKKEEEEKPSCTPTSFSGVTVTEFLPDPLGDETAGEWLELKNTSSVPVDFCGWSIDDEEGGSKPYRLDAHALLPDDYLLLPRKETKIALNNDCDSVRLIAPLSNGGTGELLEIPYEKSATGESYALRDDGQWLWSSRPTPGAANLFREVSTFIGASPIIISAALPDPEGQDEGEEWVELTNITDRSQWLLGAWRLRLHDGKEIPLHGTGFRSGATIRIPIVQGMTLRNTDGVVLLIDPADQVRSVLAWEKSKAGQAVEREISDRVLLTHALYQGDGVLRGRLNGERPAHTWTMTDLVPLRDDPVYSFVIDEREALIRSLIENKKVELQMSADSQTIERLFLDGEDHFPLLLRLGLAHVPGRETLSSHAEYVVYEAEARREKRGIWRNAITASHIDLLKEAERVRDIVGREGVHLTVGPEPGLVEQGALIELATNVPAVIYRESVAGEWVPFIGGAVTRDGLMRFKARFGEGGDALWSDVLTQEYIVRREHYPRCISVTEVYPSPQKGEVEWVELNNHCDQDTALAGWLIDDEEGTGSKPFVLDMDPAVPAHSSLLLSGALLKVTLNNGGDQVVLRSPDGALAAYLSYPSTRKGWSYALLGDTYCLTQKPTPNASNECFLLPIVKKSKAKSAKKAIVGLATKYVVGLQSVSDIPFRQSDLRAQLSNQMAGNGGILLATVPSSVPWQLLFSVILSILAVGGWWGVKGMRD